MADSIVVTDWLWHMALRELDPAPVWPDTSTISPGFSEYPRALVQAVVDYLSEDLGCDHQVGICMCGVIAVVHELLLNLDGKETCAACSGDGFTWSREKYEAAKVRYADEADFWDLESEGYVDCVTCNRQGVVSQDA